MKKETLIATDPEKFHADEVFTKATIIKGYTSKNKNKTIEVIQ